MTTSRKVVQAFIWGLFFVMTLSMVSGCDPIRTYSPGQSKAKPDCNRSNRPEIYTVKVMFDRGCVVNAIPDGESGCTSDDGDNAVCLCASRNERLAWKADTNDVEFAVHFSPFNNGSFASRNGEIPGERIRIVGKAPTNSEVEYYYSITSETDTCAVYDPPVIVKQ